MVVEGKQILIMIIVIVVFFLISILSVVGIYFFNPSLLGFPEVDAIADTTETTQNTTSIPVTKTITVSENRLNYYEKVLGKKKLLESQKDSLLTETAMLNDSLKQVYVNMIKADSTKKEAEELLQDTLSAIKTLKDSIFTLNVKLKKSNNKLEDLRQTVENQEDYIIQEADSLEEVNFSQFAKIYNNTSPAEVAKILEQIDERDAARILKQMSNKQAGKVLEAMTPENAAAILLLGADK